MSDQQPKFAPGSLYGGISFPGQPSIPSAFASSSSSSAAPAPTAKEVEAKQSSWSSALAFAPVPRRPPPKKSTGRAPISFNFTTPAQHDASLTASSSPATSSSMPAAIAIAPSSKATISAAPVLATVACPASPTPPSKSETADAPSTGGGRSLPSLSLDEDVNGFKKRAGAGADHGGASKKRRRQQQQHPMFNPHELYDPAKPNDLAEYKKWRKDEKRRKERARREKRERMAQEQRRGGAGSDSEGSYYSEDEREGLGAGGIGARQGVPPPSSYSDAPKASFPVFTSASSSSAAPPFLPPPPSEAPSLSLAESGEEAYLRRAGLSAAPHLTVPIPPSSSSPSFASGLDPHTQPFVPSGNPTHPSSPPAEPDVQQATPLDPDAFRKRLEEAKARAAAVTAKFVVPPSFGGPILGVAKEEEEEAKEKDPRDFATRMMDKWGHKEGEGLGADSSGIINPLMVSATPKLSKKQQQEDSSGGGGSRSVGGGAMGKVISETTARKQAEDEARYGRPSRIICLLGMVGSPDEIDDDLSGDVAEECGKHGVVERVAIHIVYPPPADPAEAVRIFVVFSGPAGAWTALRALDGRFFGGRTVAARYFDEGRFDRGDRDD